MRAWGLLVGLVAIGCGRVGFDPLASDDGGTCLADVTSDPANCGACGHGCVGGDCIDSKCTSVALASGQGDLRGVVVDATHVYWVGPGAVTRVATSGGATEQVATFSGTGFRMIAFAGYLYWVTRDTGLVARARMQASSTTEIIATGQGDVGGVATDGTAVYWNNYPTNGQLFSGTVTGGAPTPLLAMPADDLTFVRLVGNTIYYVEQAAALMRYDLPNGPEVSVVDSIGSWECAIDGDDMFLANAAQDRILRVSLSGSTTPFEVTETVGPWGIAVDATHVYFANEGDDTIARAPRNGGPAEILATSSVPVGIAIDDKAVYWTTRGGDVMKVAK